MGKKQNALRVDGDKLVVVDPAGEAVGSPIDCENVVKVEVVKIATIWTLQVTTRESKLV